MYGKVLFRRILNAQDIVREHELSNSWSHQAAHSLHQADLEACISMTTLIHAGAELVTGSLGSLDPQIESLLDGDNGLEAQV